MRARLLLILSIALLGGCGGPSVDVDRPRVAQPASPAPPPPPGPTSTAAAASGPEITLEQLLDVHRAFSPRALDADRFVFLSDAPGTA